MKKKKISISAAMLISMVLGLVVFHRVDQTLWHYLRKPAKDVHGSRNLCIHYSRNCSGC